MDHWTQKYIGMPYVEDQFDCGNLAQLVNREVFSRDIRLPEGRDYAGKEGAAKLRAMTAQIAAEKSSYATPTNAPVEGDGVLIVSRGHSAHIGIYALIAGEAWVLHCASNALQAVLHRIRDLPSKGYTVEGYYSWI